MRLAAVCRLDTQPHLAPGLVAQQFAGVGHVCGRHAVDHGDDVAFVDIQIKPCQRRASLRFIRVRLINVLDAMAARLWVVQQQRAERRRLNALRAGAVIAAVDEDMQR